MPKKPAIGLIACPACDFNDAEVFMDRSEHPYIACPECGAQLFAHKHAKRAEGIKRKMRAVTAPGAAAPGQSPPAASPAPAGQASGGGDPPKKKPGGFRVLLDD